MTRFTDRASFDGALTKTDDGWAVMARVARGGNVQSYLGSEIGVEDKAVIRVYRPEGEVFDRKAFATYARKPIVIGHPAGGVTPETWKDLAVGEIDRDVVRDGEFVAVPLLFRDARAIDAIAAGLRELSMGYDAKITLQDGMTPKGEAYDAIMTDFRMNHVAVVAAARGGSELRIGDGAETWGLAPITPSDKKETNMSDALKTVVLGDKAAQVAVADAPTIEQFKTDQAKALADAAAEYDKAIAAKDAAIAAKDAEIADLKAKVLTDAALDARVAERADLVTKAKVIAPDLKTDGMTDSAIRKAVVEAKVGDMAGKSDAYIDARFDILSDTVPDPVADALKSAPQDAAKPNPVSAREKMIADMKAGYKPVAA